MPRRGGRRCVRLARERSARPADTNGRLLELNREIAAGKIEYHPFD